MATGNAVWGIDVGQCSIKALRCVRGEDGSIVADAFDYIEYPKILSQPEADPDELIRDALKQFLSRNEVKDDSVAVSVSGQSGLARFIKLPPVEEKKIPDIVKFEAKQQIPFDLDDVIWDYKILPGSETAGVTTEVGLFAMKRDQVFRSIRPFEDAGIDLECVQLVPLSLYNYAVYDCLDNLENDDDYDPDDPPESLVLLSVGTETTDLVVTNGYKVWQRNIPLGGNNFTKQLTRELKLTFAKAEHLKRNARQAEDPKTIFQAMRTEFNALATEIQRSLGYHNTIERNAKIGKILAIGNATKLPGLCQYLEKKLGMTTASGAPVHVSQIDSFPKLDDSSIQSAPAYAENRPSFTVCYGLCLQGFNEAKLTTNLLPPEILTNRLVQRKKPWILATAAMLLLGLTINLGFNARAWRSARADNFASAMSQVDSTTRRQSDLEGTHDTEKATADYLKQVGEAVAGNSERRLLWPELLAAINKSFPSPASIQILSNKEEPIEKRKELYCEFIESQYYPELADWFNEDVQRKYRESGGKLPAASSSDEDSGEDGGASAAAGPSGPGWVIEISGFHFFRGTGPTHAGRKHVRETLLRKLMNGTIKLPGATTDPDKAPSIVINSMQDLGIAYPILATDSDIEKVTIDNPDYKGEEGESKEGESPVENGDSTIPQKLDLERYSFKVQFCWMEKTATQRKLEREARERERLLQLEAERQNQESE